MSRLRTLCGLAGAAWIVAGIVAMLLPGEDIPDGIVNDDALAHVVAFAVVVALWLIALPGRAAAVLVTAVLAAGASEVVQATAGVSRSAQWTDLVADATGIGIGLAVGLLASAAVAVWERRVVRG